MFEHVMSSVAGIGWRGLVVTDLTELLLPSGNQVTSHLVLPLSPGLVGLPIYHYVAVVEFGPGGTPIAFTSSGRLLLTLGLF